MSDLRQMIHLVPVGPPQDLCSAVADCAAAVGAGWLERTADGIATPEATYACSVEVSGPDSGPLEALIENLGDVGNLVDASASVALVGSDVHFIECPPAPFRLSYLMRRRGDFDHDAYLTRYRDIHSQFGMATPGIDGYTQFHVDPGASAQLGARLGLGVSDFDSVSELHLPSVESFLTAVAESEVGAEAAADEELFVDRARSAMYTSVVCSSIGAGNK